MPALPEGRRGRALALALLGAMLGLSWLAVGSPALGWYEAREAFLVRQRALALRMTEIAAALPALERSAAQPDRPNRLAALLPGASDALAAAGLQERLGTLTHGNDVTLVSSDPLPAQPMGQLRRIALRLVLTARYASLVALLQAVAEETPTMLVDELSLRAPVGIVAAQPLPLEISMTISAFRAADAQGGPPP